MGQDIVLLRGLVKNHDVRDFDIDALAIWPIVNTG